MSEEQEQKQEQKPKKAPKKHVALKSLCTSKGMVKKGEVFACSTKELEVFKSGKAV